MYPNEDDWRNVVNDVRKALNYFGEYLSRSSGHNFTPYPLLGKDERAIPTEEELQEWENAFPGSRAIIEDMAQKEMHHRLRMKELNKYKFFSFLWR